MVDALMSVATQMAATTAFVQEATTLQLIVTHAKVYPCTTWMLFNTSKIKVWV